MEFFKQFENLYLSPKKLARKGLDHLVEAIADTNKDLQASEHECLERASYHLGEADRIYKHALDAFKEDEFDQCKFLVESSVVHLRIAEQILQSSADVVFEPDFAHDSAEYLVNHLLESIAKTKLTVEYGNYQVSPRVHDCLMRVVKMLGLALDTLQESEEEDARHLADAGILLLYWVLMQIEIENNEPVFEVELPNRTGNKFDASMKQLVKNLGDCRKLFLQRGETLAKQAEGHLAEAEKYFDQCLDNIVDNDFDEIETNIAAGMTEVKLATQLAARGAAKVSEGEEAKKDEPTAQDRIKSFKLTAWRLVTTARKSGVREPEIFEKRVDAAYSYYSRACEQMEKGVLSEAQRLAKAAFLDIDFAKQIALTRNKPQYRDL